MIDDTTAGGGGGGGEDDPCRDGGAGGGGGGGGGDAASAEITSDMKLRLDYFLLAFAVVKAAASLYAANCFRRALTRCGDWDSSNGLCSNHRL